MNTLAKTNKMPYYAAFLKFWGLGETCVILPLYNMMVSIQHDDEYNYLKGRSVIKTYFHI